MNFNKVKERMAEMTEHELDSDVMEMLNWLINKVAELENRAATIEKETAESCVEIAEDEMVCCNDIQHCSCWEEIAIAIRSKHNLEMIDYDDREDDAA